MSKRVCLVKDPRCGTRAGAQAHARYGEYACPPCLAADRAYHRVRGKAASRARQRTLIELRHRHAKEFAAFLERHLAEVDAEIAASGEQVSAKTRHNRARQRALCSLGKKFRPEYQRLYTDKLIKILMEEADAG